MGVRGVKNRGFGGSKPGLKAFPGGFRRKIGVRGPKMGPKGGVPPQKGQKWRKMVKKVEKSEKTGSKNGNDFKNERQNQARFLGF